ncbi:MAG: molybdopterin-dependent oxidoreductase [Nitrospirae bacterium]|nr:molybdopterin-dependent oxidoreductase [Nitrospirota bacterium]
MKRRDFLGVVAASAAASTACHEINLQRIVGDVPVRPAPSLRPGIEKYVETLCGACAAGCGIRVRVVDGNAVQVEGLKDHPVNDGGICPRGAAEIQNLYHPARLSQPLLRKSKQEPMEGVPWDAALAAASLELRAAQERRAGILFVVGPTASPAEVEVVTRMVQELRGAGVVRLAVPMYELPEDAFRLMLGVENARYDLPRAEYILTIQSDWLQASHSPIEMQRTFAELRRSRSDRRIRMVHAGSRLSITALKSDRWIPIRPEGGAAFAHSIAAVLLEKGRHDPKAESLKGFGNYREWVLSRFGGDNLGLECGVEPESIREVAEEFGNRRPAIAVGRRGSLAEQCAVTALNLVVGSIGVAGGILPGGRVPIQAAAYSTSPSADGYPAEVTEGKRPSPQVVILYKANPLFGLADSTAWSRLLGSASIRTIVLGSFEDESARTADLVLPLSTPLESRQFRWGMTFSREPVLSVGPAALPPLHATRSGMDVLFDLAGRSGSKLPWGNSEEFVNRLLAEAGAESLAKKGGTWAFPAESARPAGSARFVLGPPPVPESKGAGKKLRLDVYPLLAFPYGEGAHLPYLHGLTAPSGREVWSSWVEIHPETAAQHGIQDGDRVEVRSDLGALTTVARVAHGIHPSAVAMPLGLGRKALGVFADGHGADPTALLAPSLDPDTRRHTWEGTQVEVRKI